VELFGVLENPLIPTHRYRGSLQQQAGYWRGTPTAPGQSDVYSIERFWTPTLQAGALLADRMQYAERFGGSSEVGPQRRSRRSPKRAPQATFPPLGLLANFRVARDSSGKGPTNSYLLGSRRRKS
jgi:hypothetical protein